jgi:thiamine pyrophosphate-dependent acetolactate synthase large subunit-like protein
VEGGGGVTTRTTTRPPRGVELPALDPAAGRPPGYGSDLVADLLRELGVRYLPMNPGSSWRGLHDSVVNRGGNRDPQLLLCLHEEIAVSLAHAYSKATGMVGVAAVHDLVGLMHASMAVYDAFADRTPLLVLGGSGPADPAQRRPIDWLHSAQTQAQLVRDYVVWDAEPATPAAFVSDVLRAHQRACSAPCGPAYVSLDAGVQEAPLAEPVPLPDLAVHAPAPRMAPDPEQVQRAARLLATADRPVVVAGRVGLDPAATAPLTALVEMLGAAYRDDRNTVVLPTAHPQNLTGAPDLLHEADVVVAVDVVDLPGLLSRRSRKRADDDTAPGPNPAVVDVSHGDLGLRSWSNAFAVPVARTVALQGDPLLGVQHLTDALAPLLDANVTDQRRARVREHGTALRAAQQEAVKACWDDVPLSPARLVAELWETVRDVPHLLCLRNTRSWPEGVWQFPGAGSYLGHSGGGGVGYGPGAMVGGALAARDSGRLGVGIIGDGDLLMAAGALWTATHYGIPMLLVVNDNGSFHNDEEHQAAMAQERGRPTENSWIGMRIAGPAVDIAGLARSYGALAQGPVEHPDDLQPALRRALDDAGAGAVAVVHVRTATR